MSDPNRLRFGNPSHCIKKYPRTNGTKVWRIQYSGSWIKTERYTEGNRFYLSEYIRDLPFQQVVEYQESIRKKKKERDEKGGNEYIPPNGTKMPKTREELHKLMQYGDIIWGGYANCYHGESLYFVGGNYWDRKSWHLNKARSLIRMGEMYYAIPLEFSDAPLNYYEQKKEKHCEIIEEFIDLSKMEILSQDKKEFLMENIEEVRKNGDGKKSVHKTENMYSDSNIDLTCFPSGYYAHFEIQGTFKALGFIQKEEEMCFEVQSDLEPEHDRNFFEELYKERKLLFKKLKEDSSVILAGTIHHKLPWEICLLILSFEDFGVY